MSTTRPFLSSALIALAVTLLTPGSLRAQTGAASLTGIVTDQSGAAVPGRHRHGDQPGHERRLHRRLERCRQLHHDVAAGRHVCRQGGARAASRPRRPSRSRSKRSRSSASTSSSSSAARGDRRSDQRDAGAADRDGDRRRGHLGHDAPALPLNGRNTGQLSLLLPGAVTPNPERVHRRSATSAAAGRT